MATKRILAQHSKPNKRKFFLYMYEEIVLYLTQEPPYIDIDAKQQKKKKKTKMNLLVFFPHFKKKKKKLEAFFIRKHNSGYLNTNRFLSIFTALQPLLLLCVRLLDLLPRDRTRSDEGGGRGRGASGGRSEEDERKRLEVQNPLHKWPFHRFLAPND